MTLTKKEFMYLKWLGLFIAVYVFWSFVWLPMNNTLSAKQSNLTDLRLIQTTAQQSILSYDTVIIQESEIKTTTEGLFSKFFDVQTPAQTEAYLIPILTQHHGKISAFVVTNATVVVPETTLQNKEQLTYKIKELVDQYNKIVTQPSSLPVTDSQLLKTQMNYLIIIGYSDYLNLLHTINSMDRTMLISSAYYNMNDGLARIVIDVYSIEKIKLDD